MGNYGSCFCLRHRGHLTPVQIVKIAGRFVNLFSL